ncbi:zinc finger protein 879-like [Maniola jurtina]|uniref:zinc finger protein 879-like n=1 Tax=Maniola jurtina TaxID=191418 RepID=UPI001E68E175|nr:zinc finger protein 879-like [Maniola jurtina]
MDFDIDSGLVSSAIPLPAQFCMICLDTTENCKLYPVHKYNLAAEFQKLTGISLQLQGDVHFVPQFCTECAHRLGNCSTFRDKSLRAYRLLQDLVKKHETLTTQNIRTIDRKENQLSSNIGKKIYEPDYCDFHLTDIKIHYNPQKKDVKKESVVLEDTEPIFNVKCEVEIFNSDTFDGAIIISKDDTDNKKNQSAIKDLKNDTESKDHDIDIDVCDDTDYLNYDMGNETDRKIKREKIINKKQIRNSRTKINTVKGRKKPIKSEHRVLKKKPVQKDSVNENKLSDIVVKIVKKRVRKKKLPPGTKRVPKTKLDLKLIEEIELTQEQQIAEILKRQASDNYKNSSHKCNICYKGYYHLEAYNAHMDRHTDKFGLFECDVCRLRFKSKFTLKKHMYNHRVIYKCTKCQFVSNHRTAVVHHERWHDGKIYKCTHCEEKFTKCTSLMSHIRIKHPSDYVCTQCGFSFIGERGLHLHMRKKHSFVDTQNLAGPLCEPCNIRFASGEAYLQHMQASPKHAPVGQLRPNCPNQKKMNKKMSIDCEQCGVKLESLRQYSMHFKAEHPDKVRTQFPKDKVTLESNVMCEKCGKTFTAPVYLRDHMQKHTGIKLYKCDICDKSFMQKSTLTNHIHRHSDNLACDVCHKPFSNAANLQRHMVSHQAVRPYYKCDFCGKSYTSIPGRDLHVAHVHLNVPWPKRVRGKRSRAKARRYSVTSDSLD